MAFSGHATTHSPHERHAAALGVYALRRPCARRFSFAKKPSAAKSASAVICNQKPVTMRFDGELPRLAPRRLSMTGAPRTLVAVPAMAWGRCVAVIEIIDADERLANRVAYSGAYVAARLAEFMSQQAAA